MIDFQLEVVLHVESIELKVVLIENEAGNVNEGPKMHRLFGLDFKSQRIPVVVYLLLPVPPETPLHLVIEADLVFFVLVSADLTVRLDCHDSRHLLIVFLFDEVTLPAEA